MKRWIIAVLLSVYPAGWRREYGLELRHMLHSRSLTAAVAGDVFRNGLWQRLRAPELSTRFGLAMALLILCLYIWNIVAPLSDGHNQAALLLQYPSASYIYVGLLVACGCLTRLQDPRKNPGRAAAKASFIASIPTMLVGLLVLFGVIEVSVVGPGGPVAGFREHGLTYTYYSAQQYCWIRVGPSVSSIAKLRALQYATCPPSAWAYLVAPLMGLPLAGVWGSVGGLLGRWIARGERPSVVK